MRSLIKLNSTNEYNENDFSNVEYDNLSIDESECTCDLLNKNFVTYCKNEKSLHYKKIVQVEYIICTSDTGIQSLEQNILITQNFRITSDTFGIEFSMGISQANSMKYIINTQDNFFIGSQLSKGHKNHIYAAGVPTGNHADPPYITNAFNPVTEVDTNLHYLTYCLTGANNYCQFLIDSPPCSVSLQPASILNLTKQNIYLFPGAMTRDEKIGKFLLKENRADYFKAAIIPIRIKNTPMLLDVISKNTYTASYLGAGPDL